MKKFLSALMALAMLTGAFALGESGSELAQIQLNVPVYADLDGDGTEECLTWAYVPGEYDEHLQLAVTADSGKGVTVVYDTDIMYSETLYLGDLDGDGRTEMLASGDEMSDDYATWCLRYDQGRLFELLFADASRSETNGNGYYPAGYGSITGWKDGLLTLSGSQDVLGTWFGSRDFCLAPSGRFELADDGWWIRDVDAESEWLWEYGALTLKASLEYTDPDGNVRPLAPGDRIVITASDKQTAARFLTQDGRTGTLAIEHDYETGWGFLVEGIPESELFGYIPYAD